MRSRIIVFAATVALSAAAFGNAPSFGAAAPAGDPVKGKANFERVGCYQCHGHRGPGRTRRSAHRGAGPAGVRRPCNAFVRTTSGDMPPFTEKVLSDQELIDIYAYLQSVPAPPDHKTIPLLSQ